MFDFLHTYHRDSGVVYKFKSCANYYNHGQATRTLAADEEQRLLAALDTVSAIPRDRQTDNRVSDGAPAMACDSKPKKPKATTVQQRKEEVTGKPEPPNRRKRTVMATEKKREYGVQENVESTAGT